MLEGILAMRDDPLAVARKHTVDHCGCVRRTVLLLLLG